MTLKELGEKCKERDIECGGCPYRKECEEMAVILEDISPCGILDVLERTV